MDDIWLTPAARSELDELPRSQADAVHEAIGGIATEPGQRIDLVGAPIAEPFLVKEPDNPNAPAVIYRRSGTDELGDWLVVSLINRDVYLAAQQAQKALANYPEVRDIVNAAVATAVAATTPTTTTGHRRRRASSSHLRLVSDPPTLDGGGWNR